jgi:hypothetical protein
VSPTDLFGGINHCSVFFELVECQVARFGDRLETWLLQNPRRSKNLLCRVSGGWGKVKVATTNNSV